MSARGATRVSVLMPVLDRERYVDEALESVLATALGRDVKGKISPAIYVVAIGLAFFNAGLAWGLYVLVAVMWLIPDQRIEKTLTR